VLERQACHRCERQRQEQREKLQLATSAGLSMMICYHISAIQEYTHEKYFKLFCPFEPTLRKKLKLKKPKLQELCVTTGPLTLALITFWSAQQGGRIRQGKSPAREWLARAIPIFSIKVLTPKARTHGARVHGAASCCARVYINYIPARVPHEIGILITIPAHSFLRYICGK
jgi:hypothetical protein